MFGKSEMLSEEDEDGDVMIERSSVSPKELVDSEFDSLRCSLGPAGVRGCVLSVDPPGWAGWARLSGGGVAAVRFLPFLVPMLPQYSDHALSEVMIFVLREGVWLFADGQN